MQPVNQTRLGKNGNCFQACVASVLDLELDDVPDFCNDYSADDWFNAFRVWLHQRGMSAMMFKMNNMEEDDGELDRILAGAYALVGGNTVRGEVYHEVVYKDGKLIHDPYVGGAGLLGEPHDYILFTVLDLATITDVAKLKAENQELFDVIDYMHSLVYQSARLRPDSPVHRDEYIDAAVELGNAVQTCTYCKEEFWPINGIDIPDGKV